MVIGTFGSKKFSVSSKKIYTFNGLELSTSINTEESENGSGKPTVKKTSGASDGLSFSITLTNDNVNVRREIDDWINIQNKGTAYYMIFGKEKYGKNKWLVTSISVSDQEFLQNGIMRKATLNISFKEKVVKRTATTAKQTRKS